MSRRRFRISGALRALRLRGALLLCLIVAGLLFILGEAEVAYGLALGFLLFVLNGLLLVETGRALLLDRERSPRPVVALSTIGRLLMLGGGLAGTFLLLGRSAGLGACGGLFLSQVHLLLANRLGGLSSDA